MRREREATYLEDGSEAQTRHNLSRHYLNFQRRFIMVQKS